MDGESLEVTVALVDEGSLISYHKKNEIENILVTLPDPSVAVGAAAVGGSSGAFGVTSEGLLSDHFSQSGTAKQVDTVFIK